MRAVLPLFAPLFLVACVSASRPRSMGSEGGPVGEGASLIPPMPPDVTSFQKWEHLCLWGGVTYRQLSTSIAAAGPQGWEMVSFGFGEYGYMACFKRPVPPRAAAQPAAPAPETPPAATPPAPAPTQ
jgi:hypothetical protein